MTELIYTSLCIWCRVSNNAQRGSCLLRMRDRHRMKKPVKNYAKSVKTRLLNLMNYTDEARLLRWKAFMKKIQWKEDLAFPDVMRVITTRLEPMYNKYWEK